MQIILHEINHSRIAEVISDDIIIGSIEDGTDLLGNIYYQDFDKAVVYAKNISSEFFDLKTKMAGEILQKFSNHRVKLVIVGDFETFNSNSLRDFIFESNKGKQVGFVVSLQEALEKLA
jgi:hypothetical protein